MTFISAWHDYHWLTASLYLALGKQQARLLCHNVELWSAPRVAPISASLFAPVLQENREKASNSLSDLLGKCGMALCPLKSLRELLNKSAYCVNSSSNPNYVIPKMPVNIFYPVTLHCVQRWLLSRLAGSLCHCAKSHTLFLQHHRNIWWSVLSFWTLAYASHTQMLRDLHSY